MEKNNDIDESIQREKALERFLCLLYVGNENPFYKAKPWHDDNFHLQKQHMRSLEILASNEKTELAPLDKIKLAMDSSLIQRSETLMFALAMCARQKESEKLRAAAYYFLTEHCKEWKYFVQFIKYASLLCKNRCSRDKKEKDPIGWGRGWKNAVNSWYVNRDSTDLAILVGRRKSGCGWTHKDILKLSHMDTLSLDAEKRVIFKYVLEGAKSASEECDNDPRAVKQLDYLSSVADFRRCRDFDEVAEKIRTNKFTIDHLHPEVLKSKKVWESLLRDMDIRSILKYLPKMNRIGCFDKFSSSIEPLVRTLTNTSFIRWNGITPADILPLLNLYQDSTKVHFTVNENEDENAVCQNTAGKTIKRRAKKEPTEGNEKQSFDKRATETEPLNVKIREALCDALHKSLTVDITDASKKSYVVAITRPTRVAGKLLYAEVGLAIALPLLHREYASEDQTTIIVYGPREAVGSIPEITKDMNYDEALNALMIARYDLDSLKSMPAGPIEWCYRTEKKFDVFINVTSEPPSKNSIELIRSWKEIAKSDARFINVVMNRGTLELKGDIWRDVLTIKGFDSHVPFVIEAYVRGLF